MATESARSDFKPEAERRKMLLLWGPMGVLLFGVLGALVLDGKWGLTHPDVITGAGIGAGLGLLLGALLAWQWNHRYTADEVADGEYAYKNSGRGWTWASGAGATGGCTGACAVVAGSAGVTAFLMTLMTLVSILGWFTALGRRGLFQRT